MYPRQAPDSPAAALPHTLGQLSQLTSLSLGFGEAHVTTAQVDAMVQALPSLQHLTLLSKPMLRPALDAGFPINVAVSCVQLMSLSISGVQFGALPVELERMTRLTRLALGQSSVASLPVSISRLTALESFSIYSHTAAPATQICHLTALRRLEVSGPIVASLPVGIISRLTALLHLEVDTFSPTFYPSLDAEHWERAYSSCIWSLASLTRLDIPDTRSLLGISQLSALRELKLGYGWTPDLPPGMTACQQLSWLSMGSYQRSPVLASLQTLQYLRVSAYGGAQEVLWTQLTALTKLDLH